MTIPLLPQIFLSPKFSMFSIFLLTSYLSIPLLESSFIPLHFFLFIYLPRSIY
ncbi:unnamed protein product [Spirodela intermedia]|uniref:Uncharacterized protein n=1 Tax=Spirodela intermedia TaxID=51605 RepID=A0A7I8KCN1_SPIIN|nr:unnamed protein product [Spirodela intermedia]